MEINTKTDRGRLTFKHTDTYRKKRQQPDTDRQADRYVATNRSFSI